jgi:hypothetical protein
MTPGRLTKYRAIDIQSIVSANELGVAAKPIVAQLFAFNTTASIYSFAILV